MTVRRALPSPGGKGDRAAVDEERRAPPVCTDLKSALSPGHPYPRLTPRSGTLYGLPLPHSSSVSFADSFPPGEAIFAIFVVSPTAKPPAGAIR